MVRPISYAPEVVDLVDGLPLGVVTTSPTRSDDGRERISTYFVPVDCGSATARNGVRLTEPTLTDPG